MLVSEEKQKFKNSFCQFNMTKKIQILCKILKINTEECIINEL